MRPAAAFAIAVLPAAALSAALVARASPPAELDAGTDDGLIEAEIGDGDGDPTRPQIWDEPGGLWLSVELIGPRGAQLEAARSLARPPVIDALPRGGAPPPGELVGRVDTLEQALSWVDANAFAPLTEAEDATPIPGGRIYEDHGLVLTALVVTGHALGGTQPYPWPSTSALVLPAGVAWRPANLAAARAPLFAAPAPRLPPAAERYQVATAKDSVWLLGDRDSCDDAGACLRWAQVVIRHGDRFFGGWIPASLIVPDDAWVGGPQERRFALLPGHRTRGEVGFALIEERVDGREPALGLRRAHAGSSWPSAGVEVLGEELVVMIGGEVALRRHIETRPLVEP